MDGWGSKNWSVLIKYFYLRKDGAGSLVAQIIKEKYYPQENFQELGLWNRFSYARRSIWRAKDLLKVGLVWHVGDRSNIKIWKEKWLSNQPSFIV
jgi:hypothetical protein